MNISKKTSLIILGLTSLVFSRAMFSLFNDPEGPNLLVVGVAAVIIYLLSLSTFALAPSLTGLKKLILAILVQIIVVLGAFFLLK